MSEIGNGIIQMNVHLVMQEYAEAMVVIGIFMAIVATCFLIIYAGERNRIAAFCAFGILVAVILVIVGNRQPRIKEVRACVNEPISLERVVAVYDIVKVDGKELVLRERR